MKNIQRAKEQSKLPVVFTQDEAQSMLGNIEGTSALGYSTALVSGSPNVSGSG